LDPIIHIIDKSPAYCKIIENCLRGMGYSEFHTYSNSAEWIEHGTPPDIVILDQALGHNQVSGLELMRAYNTRYTNTRFIFMSSDPNVDVALQAIKSGASDYIFKGRNGLEKLVRLVETISKKKAEQKRAKASLRIWLWSLGIAGLILLAATILYLYF
jgi:DNA-binding NtrC family response regulator